MLLFRLAWGFVFVVAVYDSYFAWEYQFALPLWEQNPCALWAVQRFGLFTVLAFKFAGLVFAAGLACYCRTRYRGLCRPLTLVPSAAYALLLVHYLIAFQAADASSSLPHHAPTYVSHASR